MAKIGQKTMNRREFQRLALVLPGPLAMAVMGGRSAGIAVAQAESPTPVLAPTPACGDDDELEETLAQTAGPFFTPSSPERVSLLEPGLTGTALLVTGYVYTTDCRPLAGAVLDFWQADDGGVYDNVGYRLRGHQLSAEDGRFSLETVVPGLYPGRTRHIHVNVQAAERPVLTTQLYFPDEPANGSDGIFNADLIMDVEEADGGQRAYFTFVLDGG